MLQTPETNTKWAALNLLRFKMLKKIKEKEGSGFEPKLSVEELNEVLLVGGLEVVSPKEIEVKEIDILLDKEG